jgi:predicted ATPase/DNA-binding SARP family transcriptional activator
MENSVKRDTLLLEVRLFGSFGAWRAGEPLPLLRSRSEKWLLMLLALRPGKAISREWLSATLWPDSEAALGLYNLRRCLTNLRKALGTETNLLLAPSPQTLCLDPAHVWVDVSAFDAAAVEGSIESLEQAVALYRGALLEDCAEEWALTARIEREQAYLAALETLAAHAASVRQPTVAVRYLRLTIAADPLREAAYGALMQALADCGDYAAVTQVYRDLRLLLHQELNIAPAAETEALYRCLQQQAKQAVLPLPAPGSLPLRRLPVPLTNLVGRENDLAEVVGWLQKERLVTLLGSGGVGKTRLAIATAETLAPGYPDGVWFVELASLSDPALVAHTVARTLGVKEETGRPIVETLVNAMASRSLLLILDNCEHLLDACADLVDTLLSHCPTLRVLATSREALGLVGEHRYYTPSLTLPPIASQDRPQDFGEKDLAWLMEYGGMRLFVERAMQVQSAFRLTAQNAASVLGVVQHLDGIPLAIELAAARVRSLSIAEIQPRLHDCMALLGGGHRAALPRQKTIRALIDWSYDLLTEKEKRLLLRLSVFAGGWSLEAAESVCADLERERPLLPPDAAGFSALSREDLLDVLTALTDKSLVIYEESRGGARYRMLETVRQYARDRLTESGETLVCRRRHRDYFLALAEEGNQKLKGPEQAQWLRALETEHDNLHQAVRLCLEQGEIAEIGLRLGAALQRFWQTRGHLTEGRECLNALLARPEAAARARARAAALNGAGRLAAKQGDYASARSWHEESLEIFRELGDRQGSAHSLIELGAMAWSQGDYASALSMMEEALEPLRETGDQLGIATAVGLQALVAWNQGDYASARTLQEEELGIRRAVGDFHGVANALGNQGLVDYALGNYASARSLHEESVEIFRELGDRYGIAHSLCNLATVFWQQGDYATFSALQEESLEIRRQFGDRRGIAQCLNNLATVAANQGDYASARALFEESLERRRQLGDRNGIAHCLGNMGHAALKQGDYASAQALQEESLKIRRELGDRYGMAHCLNNLGIVAVKQGDCASAHSLQSASLEMFRELGDRHGLGLALESFANLNAAEAKHAEAARLWGAAERLREEIGSPILSSDQDEHDQHVTRVRATLDEKDFAAVWAEGRTMTTVRAIEYALEDACDLPHVSP